MRVLLLQLLRPRGVLPWQKPQHAWLLLLLAGAHPPLALPRSPGGRWCRPDTRAAHRPTRHNTLHTPTGLTRPHAQPALVGHSLPPPPPPPPPHLLLLLLLLLLRLRLRLVRLLWLRLLWLWLRLRLLWLRLRLLRSRLRLRLLLLLAMVLAMALVLVLVLMLMLVLALVMVMAMVRLRLLQPWHRVHRPLG
jgi:hypothetical protein